MRGTLYSCIVVVQCFGIIPAYAGNTPSQCRNHPTVRDHPRVCGEHRLSRLVATLTRGSSPRMRGTPDLRTSGRTRTGIIPAYAGNTFVRAGALRRMGDHPRVCGEHHHCRAVAPNVAGSSPRMRGTPVASVPALSHLGIIPAYAGNTCGYPA